MGSSPLHVEILPGLNSCRTYSWCHNFCEFICSVSCCVQKTLLSWLLVIQYLWLLQSFCALFFSDHRVLERRGHDTKLSFRAEPSTVCGSWWVNHVPVGTPKSKDSTRTAELYLVVCFLFLPWKKKGGIWGWEERKEVELGRFGKMELNMNKTHCLKFLIIK